MSNPQNRIDLRPLTAEEGGGWLATFPDLPGCMSDGESPEEALQNAIEAENAWLEANKTWQCDNAWQKNINLLASLPVSVHSELETRAKAANVSINTVMIQLLALGMKSRGQAVSQN